MNQIFGGSENLRYNKAAQHTCKSNIIASLLLSCFLNLCTILRLTARPARKAGEEKESEWNSSSQLVPFSICRHILDSGEEGLDGCERLGLGL